MRQEVLKLYRRILRFSYGGSRTQHCHRMLHHRHHSIADTSPPASPNAALGDADLQNYIQSEARRRFRLHAAETDEVRGSGCKKDLCNGSHLH